MGTSTAGIAHAAITATILNLPMGYVRSGAKDHGRGNQIEGKLLPGQKVVVVEDLISTGGSCIEVVNVLREAGADLSTKCFLISCMVHASSFYKYYSMIVPMSSPKTAFITLPSSAMPKT